MINFCKPFQLFFSRTFLTSTPKTAKTTKKNKKSILILQPTHNDFNDVVKFISKEYIPNEPTCKALGIKSCTILLDRIMLSLSQGHSLVAKCKTTGTIMGVAINEKTNPWDAQLVEKMANCVKCAKLRRVLNFYAFLERAPSIFDKYKVNEVFEVSNLGVAQDGQKLGIATKLVEESNKVAKNKKFSILRIDATSYYTARICEKMNMELIYEIPYDSYLDADRKPVFKIPSPHTGVKVYIVQLEKPKILHLTDQKGNI